MLKTLIKKQLLELFSLYFRDRKTGKIRSKGKVTLYVGLFAVLLLFLGFAFFGVGMLIAEPMIEANITWLYFSIMGILAMLLGIFGSVFNTYASLYLAKDNEMLLSMPIPPSKILLARTVSVYLIGLMYEAIVFVPSIICYLIYAPFNIVAVITSILSMFVLGFLILVLTCIFGFIVAVISSKLKNKSFITVIISVTLIAIYYYFCANYMSVINEMLLNIGEVSATVKSVAYPLYLFGKGADGNILSFLGFLAIVAVLLVIVYFVLSKTFIRIATKQRSQRKKNTKAKESKQNKPVFALFKKEWKKFSSSATYMLNCSMGTLFMVILGVVSLIFSSKIEPIADLIQEIGDFSAIIVMFASCMFSSMNMITAPSISLEGKNIWILQSMPVNVKNIFDAKQYLHYALTVPPTIIMSVCLSIAFKVEWSNAVICVLIAVVFSMFISALGLFVNLKKPNLSWTNETVPIKQSMSVMVCIFGGWAVTFVLTALTGIGIYFLHVDAYIPLALCLVILVLCTRIMNNWINTKGIKVFEKL